MARHARFAVAAVAGFMLWSASPALAASTYTVTNTGDSGAGSLRAAINSVDIAPNPPDTIVFAPSVTGVIDITSGPLAITQSVAIDGPGASTLELDGNGGQIQIMTVNGSSTASISGLEFAFGAATGAGGAIDNLGTLSVSDSVFAHNSAGGQGGANDFTGAGDGGAIDNRGSLTVIDSTFTDNTAGGNGGGGEGSGDGSGGAIYSADSLVVTGSTFTGNAAGGNGGTGPISGEGTGGAIDNSGVSMTVSNSTLTANRAGGSAGSGTFSGAGDGGAVYNADPGTLSHDTIDANVVGSAPSSLGSGIYNGMASLTSVGTIASGNTGASNCSSPVGGTISATDSLEGPAGQTSCGFDLPSADPLLGALADNGGPTETQALGAGSPAVGAVTSAGDCPATDQRAARRPQRGCDVGAYEAAPPIVGAASAPSPGMTTASLSATVSNPDVFAGSVSFQYGTSAAYGSSSAPQVLPASAPAAAYGASLTGLAPGTVYHFRVAAQNPDGPVYGPDETFTTSSPSSVSPPPSAPPSNKFVFGKASVASGGRISLPVSAPGAGRFTASATFTVRRTVIVLKHGKRAVKHVTTTFTYGTASVSATGLGTFKLVIGLKPRAAREFKLFASRQVTIAVTFTPVGGTAGRGSKNVTVKRSRKGKYS
jgi:hypothetical protein